MTSVSLQPVPSLVLLLIIQSEHKVWNKIHNNVM
jgi:hypothetical protein